MLIVFCLDILFLLITHKLLLICYYNYYHFIIFLFFEGDAKIIISAAFKAKAKAWMFEAKVIKICLKAKAWHQGLHHWYPCFYCTTTLRQGICCCKVAGALQHFTKLAYTVSP